MKFLVVLVALAGAWPLQAMSEPAAGVIRAQLTARRSAVVAAEIAAKIRQVHVAEGGAFAAGDALVSLEDSLPRAQVNRAEAVVTATQRTFASNQRLHRLNSIGQVELDLSEAEVAKATAELAYAQAMLAKCRLTAPFSGRVAEKRIHEQEFVQPGQALLEIIDDQTPEIDFIAPSKWLAWVRVGQRIEITIEETGLAYPAVVERIGARVDPVSQSIKITAEVIQPATDLMAGMSGLIRVTPESRP